MKLGLLGYPVTHSKSPELYRKFLGGKLSSYELFSYPSAVDVPSLNWFQERLDGLNITSPYKELFFSQVKIVSPLVKQIGAINTIAFGKETVGTNTDLLAVVEILKNYQKNFGNLKLLILGDGVMARLTILVADDLKIPYLQFSRKRTPAFQQLSLCQFQSKEVQNIVINTCSREYICEAGFSGEEIFWDYNYSFEPHLKTLPSKVKLYQDGQEMLELQARAAIKFWNEVGPKLK